MISQDVIDIQDFRRFVSQNIYPETFGIIIDNISSYFQTDEVGFESLPKPLIKFKMNHSNYNQSELTDMIHRGLYTIFTSYFNNQIVSKLCRSKVHECHLDINDKYRISSTLTKIQLGNCNNISLLYNITMLNGAVYLYL